MKRVYWITAACIVLLAACGKDSPADRVAGSYSCTATLTMRYQKGSEWRDTSFVEKNGNTVTITRTDDQTVGVSMHSNRWGDVTAENVKLTALSSAVNLSGRGSHDDGSQRYDANISGTFSDGTGALAVSALVKDYPYSGGKYQLAFTNR